MKKRKIAAGLLCGVLLLVFSACGTGGTQDKAKAAENTAAKLAESMLAAPSEPMQRFGGILVSGTESALSAYQDAWEDEKAMCSENGFKSFIEEVLTMQLMADEMNETVTVDTVKTEPYEEKDRIVRFTAEITVNDTDAMTVGGRFQFDEDGKVSYIDVDTNDLEMTLIANDRSDPNMTPPANGNAIVLGES